MTTKRIILAGFGGQGILFAAKQLAATGMDFGHKVTWLPSYGPEMRGGTCNCSVIVSDDDIGSPLISNPDILVAFNLPSLDKFEDSVAKGGTIFVDSTLIGRKVMRDDVEAHYIPATGMANENNLLGGANVIMLGKILAVTKLFDFDKFTEHLVNSIPPSKAKLIENNKIALNLGYNYNRQ
jgi:2-oxoglutarate ferredoxin oxidoreductase subunit gamma